MKKAIFKKSLLALALGIGVTSLSTSAFAASECPYQQQYPQNNAVYYRYNTFSMPQYFRYYLPQPAYQGNVQYPVNVQYPTNTRTQPPAQTPVKTPQKQSNQAVSQDQLVNEIVKLVNQERAKAGLQPLRLDSNLSKVALDKAKDMNNNHYFDHNSPTYGSPFDMMTKYGIHFTYAGENIAMGQQSAEEVMNQWMNSDGHRANILNPNYDTIGVAQYNGYWVQEFIKAQ